MALDLALLDHAHHDGAAVLRTYRWARPTVSFGRNEPVRHVWDVAAMQAAGYDVVRRPTGGRALLHADEVTYSVVLPLPRDVPWRVAYDAVNARLLAALRSLEVPAELHAPTDRPPVSPDGPACFAEPAAGELIVRGRKLVGSAVWRTSDAYLQHGAMLVRDTQDRLAAFRTGTPVPEPPAQATDLERWLPPSSVSAHERVTAALHEAWQAATDHVTVLPDTAVRHTVGAERRHRHAEAIGDPDWLWRR
jgi:lipoyl(octanoyl) transferase